VGDIGRSYEEMLIIIIKEMYLKILREVKINGAKGKDRVL